MLNRKIEQLAAVVLLGIIVFISGCGSETKEPQAPELSNENNGTPVVATKKIPHDTSKPDGAIRQVVEGLQEGNPQVVWNAMPASYQKDVHTLVHDFAKRMDPEVWDATFATLQKTIRVMWAKKPYLQKMTETRSMDDPNFDVKKWSADFDNSLQLLTTIVNSDLSQHSKLVEINLEHFISLTGGDIMQQVASASRLAPGDPFRKNFQASLGATEVELLSMLGDNAAAATVRITSQDPQTDKQEVKDVVFVRVEGKWIPLDLARSWRTQIDEAHTKLEAISPQMVARFKHRLLGALKIVNTGLDAMEQAKNQEEFSAAMMQTMLPIMGLAMAPPSMEPLPKTVPQSAVGKTIKLELQGKIDDQLLERIENNLLLTETDVDRTVSSTKTNDGATIQLNPIVDINSFAKTITFGKVIKVDEQNSSIIVELK